MSHSLIWLPSVLINAGLKVAMVEGWEDRGRGDVREIQGVICHHTSTNVLGSNMPTLHTLIHGRSDLRGPLSQLGLGRDGTYYVIAAGRSNHAGEGIWMGLTNGNAHFLGIEAENTGRSNDFPWPEVQLDAYHRGVAAILNHIGRSAEFCAGHREYALPRGRKPDPIFEMDKFRSVVTNILNGTRPQPGQIPSVEPGGSPGNPQGRATLRRGASGELVKLIQKKIKVHPDGHFGPKTEAAIRTFQRENNLVPDGIVGPKTWIKIDEVIIA